MIEDKKLKRYLVLQSFCPLFLLLFIRHAGNATLIRQFFSGLLSGDWTVIGKAVTSSALGDVVITIIGVIWLFMTGFVAVGFKNLQAGNFSSYGETIILKKEKKDSGVIFLVTFILPLLVDDVSTPQYFIFFIVLLAMVIFLLIRSDLFYQNPILTVLKYRTYEFCFKNPYYDVEEEKIYIGISKGEIPYGETTIRRRYIADDVFLIYKE